ncbi:hypothetical protein CPLU01_09439 [Colletotrichum plurivorum]|uniref:AB hydrolase-1 domain-containing protein n=1 Tax=Colletotrichum plurivorum TaxID=2175906 RepID=A0A8H6K8R0_9PEZI|nr:hypothetical protein CPLU01_09439 [Colletotrichum plurivorum]
MSHHHNRNCRSPAQQSPETAIVIVPDAWCLPGHYEGLAAACRALGSEVMIVNNPSTRGPVGEETAPPGLYDDAANARRIIEGLVREGKKVLIVAHSYGAVVASESVRGLGMEELTGVSQGGVVRMLFIAGIVPWEGESVREATRGMLGLGQPDGDMEGFMYHSPEKLAQCMYSSVPYSQGLRHAATTNTTQSARAFEERLTYAGYRTIPVTYMVTGADRTVPPALQERFIGVVEAEAGRAVDVFRYSVDHCPAVTGPDAVVDCVRRAAGTEGYPNCTWI